MVYNVIMDKFMPERVAAALTEEQAAEVAIAVDNFEKTGQPFKTADFLRSTNLGINYMAMLIPLKYSIVEFPHISENELLEMVEFDSQRLDPYHELMWSTRAAQGLWEQRFSLTMAAFGNPNLTGASVDVLIQRLLETSPEPLGEPDLLQTIGWQLLDKWSPEKFNASVLLALVTNFEFQGVTEYLPKFKHLQRRAAKAL